MTMRLEYLLGEDAEISIRDEVDGQHLEIASSGAELSLQVDHLHLQRIALLLSEYGYPFEEQSA
jgi:hypothetical protein